MLAVVIAFVCCYHAERVLSAIAKFIVHLLGEGKRRLKWKKGEVGKEMGREVAGARMECTKYNSAETQQISSFGDAP